jgi:hypothetical protein
MIRQNGPASGLHSAPPEKGRQSWHFPDVMTSEIVGIQLAEHARQPLPRRRADERRANLRRHPEKRLACGLRRQLVPDEQTLVSRKRFEQLRDVSRVQEGQAPLELDLDSAARIFVHRVIVSPADNRRSTQNGRPTYSSCAATRASDSSP